jgi:hypothetical protein
MHFEVLRVLRTALNRARLEELLTRNVAELVDMPKVTKEEGKPWSAHEAIEFLRAARAHRLYAACVLVLVLGLRRSEVLACAGRTSTSTASSSPRSSRSSTTTAAWC